jgi:hypothetical protein
MVSRRNLRGFDRVSPNLRWIRKTSKWAGIAVGRAMLVFLGLCFVPSERPDRAHPASPETEYWPMSAAMPSPFPAGMSS